VGDIPISNQHIFFGITVGDIQISNQHIFFGITGGRYTNL
jgi:hypothetical protein